jgi:hypothetical protein
MQFTTIDVNNDLKSGENGAAHEKFNLEMNISM